MLFTMKAAKIIMVTCSLSGFTGMPKQVTGELVTKTKSFMMVKVSNQDKTDSITISVKRDKCSIIGEAKDAK